MKLLIFDLDGTIADTKRSVCDAVNIAMEHFSKPSVTPDDVERAMGNGALMLIRRLLPKADRENEELVRTVFEFYDKTYDDTCMNAPLYDGMLDTLKELKARGYTLAVLSNKQDRYVKKMMDAYFDAGMLAISQGQRADLPAKPDPTVPLMIAEKLGFVPSDCAFIGDSDVDVLTAKNAGMVGVACAWGYRPEEVLAANSPEFLIHYPRELVNIFN
jgi:phosphoglycolate phosphatase